MNSQNKDKQSCIIPLAESSRVVLTVVLQICFVAHNQRHLNICTMTCGHYSRAHTTQYIPHARALHNVASFDVARNETNLKHVTTAKLF